MIPNERLAAELAPQIWLHIKELGEKDTWYAAVYSTMLVMLGEERGLDLSDHDKVVELEAELCLNTGRFLARAVTEGDLTVEDALNEKNNDN